MAVGGRLTSAPTARGGWGEVRVDEAAIRALSEPTGPVGAYLARGAQAVVKGAKRRAPTSARGSAKGRRSGWLRSQIGWALAADTDGTLYVVITSPALSATGAPYGVFQNVPHLIGRARNGRRYPIKTTPHLIPALDDWPR